MSDWTSTFLDRPGGWGTTDAKCNNWDHNRPKNKAPGCAVIFLNHNDAPFLEEERSENMRAIEKGALFNLLTTSVLNVIVDWISGLEHSVKFNNVMMQISSPHMYVLCITTYKNWDCLLDFRNLSLYNTIRYVWVDICYEKSEYGWGPDSPWVRNKHGLI